MTPPIIELRDIRKLYNLRQGLVRRLRNKARPVPAVDGVSFAVPPGAIFGLVGESGSGKSTLAQIMVRLVAPTSGQMLYRGQDVATLDAAGRRAFRQGVQMVFQDTGSSLNPRKRIRRVLDEALSARGVPRPARPAEAARLMDRVGLDLPLLDRFPHELSGGQRQRVGIARALAMAPDLLIADEPVSALDVSLQGQIINLLQDIQPLARPQHRPHQPRPGRRRPRLLRPRRHEQGPHRRNRPPRPRPRLPRTPVHTCPPGRRTPRSRRPPRGRPGRCVGRSSTPPPPCQGGTGRKVYAAWAWALAMLAPLCAAR